MSINIKQGQAEKFALYLFAILPLAAIASCFAPMPIWVKFFNLAIAGGAFYMMYKANTKATFSEVLMIIVWVLAAGIMAWLTFANKA